MEFFLIKEKRVILNKTVTTADKVEMLSEPTKVTISPVNDASEEAKNYCTALENLLAKNFAERNGWSQNNVMYDTVRECIELTFTSPDKGRIDLDFRTWIGSGINGASLPIEFEHAFGENNFKFTHRVDLHSIREPNKKICLSNDIPGKNLTSDEAPLNENEPPEFPFPTGFYESLRTDAFQGFVTVKVTLNAVAFDKLFVATPDRKDLVKKSRRILNEASFSDLVIIAGNGVPVKCHKNFLAASSDVFMAMLESEMEEATCNSLKMTDMSEEAVRALLAFIYTYDLVEAFKSCDIALELLRAAHKYQIEDLLNGLKPMICAKSFTWFTVEMSLELLLFVKNWDENVDRTKSDLLEKAVHALKFHARASDENITKCAEMEELFSTNPEVALETFTLVLKA